MSKHDDLITKYKTSGQDVTIGMPSLGLFRAVIKDFAPPDDQVVAESKDPKYPGLHFACHKNALVFMVKS